MIRAKNVTLRRLVATSHNHVNVFRSYHASSKLGADALDMVDTFARRHSKFLPLPEKLSGVCFDRVRVE